jgi:hypothetical protein
MAAAKLVVLPQPKEERSRPGNELKQSVRSSTQTKATDGVIRASNVSGKVFSGGPDHKTPSFLGTGGGTVRTSFALNPLSPLNATPAVGGLVSPNQTMYGTQFLFRVD